MNEQDLKAFDGWFRNYRLRALENIRWSTRVILEEAWQAALEYERSKVVFDILKIIDNHMCLGDCNSNWLFLKSDLRKYFKTENEGE